MKLAITYDGTEYSVWAMLDDPDFNPNPCERGEAFVIGLGATRDAAVDAAILTLARAVPQAHQLRMSDDDTPLPPTRGSVPP